MSGPRNLYISVLLGFSTLIISVGLCEFASRLLYPSWHEFSAHHFLKTVHFEGYRPLMIGRPGFDGYFAQNDEDFRVHMFINEAGHRAPTPASSAEGKIWLLGDSFSFGWGVSEAASVAGRLTDAGLPTYNLSSPGADVCGYQTIYIQSAKELRPRAVVLGLTVENDILPYDCQPGSYTLQPNEIRYSQEGFFQVPLKYWLIKNSAIYNLLAVSIKKSPALRDALVWSGVIAEENTLKGQFSESEMGSRVKSTVEAIDWIRQVAPDNIPFVVFIIPTRAEVSGEIGFFNQLREQIVEALSTRGISVVDPSEDLKRTGADVVHFHHDGHWAEEGHAIAASLIANQLRFQFETRGHE